MTARVVVGALVGLGLGLALVAAIAVNAFGGLAARANPTWSPPNPDPSASVAIVDGETMAWSAVAEQLHAAEMMGQPAAANPDEWRRRVDATIESIIGDVLTRQYVETQGFVVTPELIDAEVAKVEAGYGGPDQLRRAMDEMHVTMAQLRETQRRGLYTQTLIDLVVPATDAQIDAYLAQPGTAGMTRDEAADRVRAEHAAEIIGPFLADLRSGAQIQLTDITTLE
jgi:hypothetical protein